MYQKIRNLQFIFLTRQLQFIFLTRLWSWNKVMVSKPKMAIEIPTQVIMTRSLKVLAFIVSEKKPTLTDNPPAGLTVIIRQTHILHLSQKRNISDITLRCHYFEWIEKQWSLSPRKASCIKVAPATKPSNCSPVLPSTADIDAGTHDSRGVCISWWYIFAFGF